LRSLADLPQDLAGVGDARNANHDVLALEVHLRTRDAKSVDAVGQDSHDLLHVGVGGVGGRLVDDRQAASEVETQLGSPAEREGRYQRSERDNKYQDEADDHRPS
jgi:hypothetical protein